MKITLVHPKYFNSWEALGLAYIGAFLEQALPSVELRYFQGVFDDDELIVSGASESDIVAFSCTTPTFPHAVRLARALKSTNAGIRTVVGGYGPSSAPQASLVDGIDQVVIGEGEDAMLQIAHGLRDPIVRGRAMGFDELPFPNRQLVRNERNIQVAYNDNQLRITSFQSHRACPFMCKFCLDGFNKVLYDGARKAPVRYRPAHHLLDEIEQVVDAYKLDLIKFSDPTWNTDVGWVTDFCRTKIQRRVDVPFYPNIHATIATEEMVNLMAEAGCRQIAVGIESGSPKILKQIGKGVSVDTIRRTVKWAKSAGILVRGYFLLGMPEESHEDLMMTERFADELELDEYGFTILCPYPGTAMHDESKLSGVKWELTDEYSNDFWRTNYLSNEELKQWQARLADRFSRRLTWHNRKLREGTAVPTTPGPIEN
jgi:radical SAM superfamily enzyme YgiQ (UPF0313 family)